MVSLALERWWGYSGTFEVEMPKPKTGVGRGGKATPTEVKRSRGNPGKRSLPTPPSIDTALANVEVGTVPPVPVWCDEFGVAVWSLLWGAGRRHLSEQHDMVLMSLLVEKLQERQKIRVWLGEDVDRRWYTTANGQTVTHPAVKQIEQMDAQITGWLSMLGFSPSDRARLGLAEIRIANDLDEYRKRKQAVGQAPSSPVVDID